MDDLTMAAIPLGRGGTMTGTTMAPPLDTHCCGRAITHDRVIALDAAADEPQLDGPPNGAQALSVNVAREIERGVSRLLRSHAIASVCELPLPDGRRADIVGLGTDGQIVIVEIKSCLADFQADLKWPEYAAWCDAFYFAVSDAFPATVLPSDTGLILADRFAGAIIREAPKSPLSAPRRKAMTLRFAKAAALRLHALRDPDAGFSDAGT